MDERVKQILRIAREHYEQDASKSVRGTTTVVLNELFSLKGADGKPLRTVEGGAVLKPPGQRPSFDQVRYLLAKALTASGTWKKRNGSAEYDNNHAPSTGSVMDDCTGPGDVGEIDATVIDVYIAAQANRKVIIGKPVLFLIIDRWSRLIIGFYITLPFRRIRLRVESSAAAAAQPQLHQRPPAEAAAASVAAAASA